jgi:hypothetical protein
MKLFAIFALLGALLMFGVVIQGLRSGRIWFKSWLDVRSQSPIQFWSSIALYLLLAIGLLFMAAKEAFLGAE